jgi:hypothetical protein
VRRAVAGVVVAIALALVWTSSASCSSSSRVRAIICKTFGRYCGQALRVAWCESRYRVGAVNGQYRGLFQMGRRERARYGNGFGPWNETRAAFRYFVASGRDWSPWECRP